MSEAVCDRKIPQNLTDFCRKMDLHPSHSLAIGSNIGSMYQLSPQSCANIDNFKKDVFIFFESQLPQF
ncbi:hypothetical protein Aduo_012210 [Ancylostoma duodenale]